MKNTKIGDVFSVEIEGGYLKFFQLVELDLLQLNSDVIRSFKKEYSKSSCPEIEEIVSGKVEFYAHCVTKFGLKSGDWLKVGNSKNVGNTNEILFRDTMDYGAIPGVITKESNNWFVWHLGDKDFTKVGKLENTNMNAEIGLIFTPKNIVARINTGVYLIRYPKPTEA